MLNQVEENYNNMKKCCKIHQMFADKTGECWMYHIYISVIYK